MTEGNSNLPKHIRECFRSGPVQVGEGSNQNLPIKWASRLSLKPMVRTGREKDKRRGFRERESNWW